MSYFSKVRFYLNFFNIDPYFYSFSIFLIETNDLTLKNMTKKLNKNSRKLKDIYQN